MSDSRIRVLIVEDEAAHAAAIRRAFESAGADAELDVVGSLREFRERIVSNPPDMALMDLTLPDGRAVEALTKQPQDGAFPILIMTSYGNEQTAVEVLKAGALDYVVKSPEAFSALPRTVARALREWNLLIERKRAVEALRESEEKYRHLVENLGKEYFFYRHDKDGVITYISPSVTDMLGYSQQEILTHYSEYLTDSPMNKEVVRHTGLSIQGHQQPPYEVEIFHKDGSARWLEVAEYPVCKQDGSVIAVEGIARDITGRKHAEEALRKSETRYRSLFQNMLEGYAYCKMLYDDQNDPVDFVYLDVNSAFEQLTGLKDVVGKQVSEVIPGIRELSPELFDICGRVALSGEPEKFEFDFKSLSQWLAISVYSPEKGHFVAFFDNITERKRMEEELKQSEEVLRSVIDNIGIGVSLISPQMEILMLNRQMLQWFPGTDASKKPICYSTFTSPPREEICSFCPTCKTLRDGEIYEAMAEAPAGSGIRNYRVLSSPVRDKGGNIIAAIEVVEDVTERKRAEEALRESERQYRQLVDNALVGVYKSTPDGKFLYVNDALAEIFECENTEEVLSLPVEKRYKRPEDRQAFLNLLKEGGKVPYFEMEVPTQTGKMKTIVVSAALDDGIISGMVVDITEQKKLEDQLRQAQKMEAVGQLAGGIAHDFNNILAAIIGYGYVTLMKMAQDDPQRLNIEHMLEAADRAAQLTQSLLAFSRKQIVLRRPVDLNGIVRKVEKFLVRVIGEDVEVRMALSQSSLNIDADSGQIEQVLMNLATNARDVMPKGGFFSIETAVTDLDKGFITAHGYGKPGGYAMIAVTDTGLGMDEETRKRIFEPFFTTKEVGKGTGLGLAMVYGIVKQHDGFINVYSEPGRGTTFRIYLPLIKADTDKGEEAAAAPEYPEGGTETILLAEDDASLRELNRSVLEQFGYTVIAAVDGEDAVKTYRENKDRIQLLFFDLTMPKKGGKEAYDEIRQMRPEVKVLFASGYTVEKVQKEGIFEEGLDFILKPVSPMGLLKKIREVLDGRNP